jgi:hypothetical protein
MAHFAELDENNVVVYVTVGRDEDDENELTQRTGKTYKKCSYNTRHGTHALGGTPFRKNYPGVGYVYDEERDAFIAPPPGGIIPRVGESYPEGHPYRLNEDTCAWDITVPKPDGYPNDDPDQSWQWDDDTQQWMGLRERFNKIHGITPITPPSGE